MFIPGKYFRKELSLCHKLIFSNPYIFATQCCGPIDISNYEGLENLSL